MIRAVSPLDEAWLLLESPETPMHVGALFELVQPDDAPPDYLQGVVARLREVPVTRSPWNLKPLRAPVVGRLPAFVEDSDVDLSYHVRHSALPRPGGQRELGVLISRLHGHQLDFGRPLWELHVVEGLDEGRFALYVKMHHSIIDGVSGMRMITRAFAKAPDDPDGVAFWGSASRTARRRPGQPVPPRQSVVRRLTKNARPVLGLVGDAAGIGRAGAELTLAAFSDRGPQAPFRAPSCALSGSVSGARRIATQRLDLHETKRLAGVLDCSLNDLVLMIASTALRRYLLAHGRVPGRSLTAGVPVNLRTADDHSAGGTNISIVVVNLATSIADASERLAAIKASTKEGKRHLQRVPRRARGVYPVLTNGPWLAGLLLGLGGRAPVPFSVTVSNVPGPSAPLYFHGARLDAIFPVSLLLHGNALNITCVSYAGELHFGFTGARDNLPHLQRLATETLSAFADVGALADA